MAKIGKAVTNFLNRHHLQKKDIYQVVQIVDMDGAYIEDSGVVFDARKSFSQYPFYGENKIFVQSPEKISSLQERNCRKSRNLERIISLPQVMGIPYDIYYFSIWMIPRKLMKRKSLPINLEMILRVFLDLLKVFTLKMLIVIR